MAKNNFIKKIKHNIFLFSILKNLAYGIVRLLFATYRLRLTNDKPTTQHWHKTPGVFYAWHQNIIASSVFFKKKNMRFHCVVSPSKDGKFVGDITKKLGLKVLYGSANKKPIKLVRSALKVLKEEKQIFLIGDGSRGPAKQLQPGISYLAKKANLPVIFIDCRAQWFVTLHKTWDKFQIPLPFSKIFVSIKKEQRSDRSSA